MTADEINAGPRKQPKDDTIPLEPVAPIAPETIPVEFVAVSTPIVPPFCNFTSQIEYIVFESGNKAVQKQLIAHVKEGKCLACYNETARIRQARPLPVRENIIKSLAKDFLVGAAFHLVWHKAFRGQNQQQAMNSFSNHFMR